MKTFCNWCRWCFRKEPFDYEDHRDWERSRTFEAFVVWLVFGVFGTGFLIGVAIGQSLESHALDAQCTNQGAIYIDRKAYFCQPIGIDTP